MADKHSFNYEERELKLGASFTNKNATSYHTIKYDFKPASVDVKKMASVDVGINNQVTVTVPHLDGAGVPQTVFKGNQRPYTKECVLIIDRVTGEITLEKLSSNIQVKKTRQESATKPRPLTPVTADFTNTTQRSTSRTRVTTNRRNANAASSGPAHATQPARYNGSAAAKLSMVRSPPRVRTTPPEAAPWQGGGSSTLASLPMIGLDEPAPAGGLPPRAERGVFPPERPERPAPDRPAPPPAANHAPAPADDSSSSSSSDSDSGSASDSDSDDDAPPQKQTGFAVPNGNPCNPPLPSDVLNADLLLSESGSDSD